MHTLDFYDSLKPSVPEILISSLNGLAGESLSHDSSRWAITMGFYHQNRLLNLNTERLLDFSPAPSKKIAIFIHGFMAHEQLWRFPGEQESEEIPPCYGNFLLRDYGYTPLYLRYNSGLHISDNGQLLSNLMDELINTYPVEIDEIIMFGHSLGGLIIRSGCHYGNQSATNWVTKVKKAFYLGTPHLGTPWEERAEGLYQYLETRNGWFARLVQKLYDSRNAAIRDLRYAHLVEEDWAVEDPLPHTSIPWQQNIKHHFVVSRLKERPDHPMNRYFGDGLVPVHSAEADASSNLNQPQVPFDQHHSVILTGVNHVRLAHSFTVYEAISNWISGKSNAAPDSPGVTSSSALKASILSKI